MKKTSSLMNDDDSQSSDGLKFVMFQSPGKCQSAVALLGPGPRQDGEVWCTFGILI